MEFNIDHIEKCIQFASLCKGKVFGDYVKYKMTSIFQVSSINIWFNTQDNAKEFITNMIAIFGSVQMINLNYHRLNIYNVIFNIIIDEICPQSNCLLYYYHNSEPYIDGLIKIDSDKYLKQAIDVIRIIESTVYNYEKLCDTYLRNRTAKIFFEVLMNTNKIFCEFSIQFIKSYNVIINLHRFHMLNDNDLRLITKCNNLFINYSLQFNKYNEDLIKRIFV